MIAPPTQIKKDDDGYYSVIRTDDVPEHEFKCLGRFVTREAAENFLRSNLRNMQKEGTDDRTSNQTN